MHRSRPAGDGRPAGPGDFEPSKEDALFSYDEAAIAAIRKDKPWERR